MDSKKYKARLMEAINNLGTSFNALNTAIYSEEPVGMDANDFIVDKYPFEGSFDEVALAVNEWVESCTKSIGEV